MVIKNLPTKICLGEKSLPITISIPSPDSSLRLKLQGNGIECEPNILTFSENAKQTFTISGLALGRKTLSFAKMGKSGRLYSKPSQSTISVRVPALEYNFELSVSSVSFGKHAQENLVLGVKSREERKMWVSLFDESLDQIRKEKSRFRSDSCPLLPFE